MYDRHEFQETISTKFNLVCDNVEKRHFLGSVMMMGLLVGSFLGGPLGWWPRNRSRHIRHRIGTEILIFDFFLFRKNNSLIALKISLKHCDKSDYQ